jgi:hypothetical protein
MNTTNFRVPQASLLLVKAARWPGEIDRIKTTEPDGAGHREPNSGMEWTLSKAAIAQLSHL